jgi:2'-5' RNA ligase
VPEENFHITYKFIGDVDEKQLNDIKSQLKGQLNKTIDTNIKLNGLGAFPSIYNPKILFIKAEDDGLLNDLFSTIEDKLSYIGIEKEKRNFVPHITLMRVKKYRIEEFLKGYYKFKEYDFGKIEKIEINIIESVLKPDGAVYRKLDI